MLTFFLFDLKKFMAEKITTKEKLLLEARRLLWARGYSNVSLREIAKGAGVDVALIGRYFGNKMGLFENTIRDAIDTKPFPEMNENRLISHCVDLFVQAPRDSETPSFLRMLMMNADDPEIGAFVRSNHIDFLQTALEEIIGNKERSALFIAAMIGFAFAEKSLRLDGIAAGHSQAYRAQLEHLLRAAVNYPIDSAKMPDAI